ncbi:hypothetical protein BDZ91DRAFT_766909 [Kalaharituber pfeilii]|nr:hypothetical protein BDZ91DRAFT_766909 [Kalaharituber pfeilii]
MCIPISATPPAPLTAPPAPASPPPQCKEWGSTEKQEQKYYPSSTIHYHTLHHHSAHLPKNLERGSTGATRTQARGKESEGGSPASSTSSTTNGSNLRRRILLSLFTDGAVTGFPFPVPVSAQGQEQEKMEKGLKEMHEAIWQLRISQVVVKAPVPSQGWRLRCHHLHCLPWSRRRNQHLSPLHLS